MVGKGGIIESSFSSKSQEIFFTSKETNNSDLNNVLLVI